MTITTQFLTMLTMVGMGSLFGASLDTYNRFFQRQKRKAWLVFINDILFWLVQGLTIFYVLFLVNKGELRFYIFLALLCGFATYQSIFKALYLKLLEYFITICKTIYRFVVKTLDIIVYRPLFWIVSLILSLLLYIGRGLFALVKMLLSFIQWILRIIFLVIKKILSILWAIFPKRIKKLIKRLYNKVAGFFMRIKKIINKWKK